MEAAASWVNYPCTTVAWGYSMSHATSGRHPMLDVTYNKKNPDIALLVALLHQVA